MGRGEYRWYGPSRKERRRRLKKKRRMLVAEGERMKEFGERLDRTMEERRGKLERLG